MSQQVLLDLLTSQHCTTSTISAVFFSRFLQQHFVLLVPAASFHCVVQPSDQLVLKLQR